MTVDYLSHYRVRSGDTLNQISRATGTSVEYLKQLNHITDPKTLRNGQELTLVGDSAYGLAHVDLFKPSVKYLECDGDPCADITQAVRDMIDFGGKNLRSPDEYSRYSAILTGDNPKTDMDESTLTVSGYNYSYGVPRGEIFTSFVDARWMNEQKLLFVQGSGIWNNNVHAKGGGLYLFDTANEQKKSLINEFDLAKLAAPYLPAENRPESLIIQQLMSVDTKTKTPQTQVQASDEKGNKYLLDVSIDAKDNAQVRWARPIKP